MIRPLSCRKVSTESDNMVIIDFDNDVVKSSAGFGLVVPKLRMYGENINANQLRLNGIMLAHHWKRKGNLRANILIEIESIVGTKTNTNRAFLCYLL